VCNRVLSCCEWGAQARRGAAGKSTSPASTHTSSMLVPYDFLTEKEITTTKTFAMEMVLTIVFLGYVFELDASKHGPRSSTLLYSSSHNLHLLPLSPSLHSPSINRCRPCPVSVTLILYLLPPSPFSLLQSIAVALARSLSLPFSIFFLSLFTLLQSIAVALARSLSLSVSVFYHSLSAFPHVL
jgi:hypothetical protein